MIKYLGSKRLLLPWILEVVASLPRVRSVLDLFSGTSRVGHALKARGYRVVANDHLAFAHVLARCYVQADRERWAASAARLLAELDRLPGRPGYITETFCLKSRFFHPRNGARIDAIREAIAARDLDPELEAIALASLLEAADRVDSTTGVQMAYLKRWAPRAEQPLALRLPRLVPRPQAGPCLALGQDALAAAATVEADLAYLDPPYNQHSYLGNYHVWESLVRWDKPAVYGVACKRVDCRVRKSPFNSRRRAEAALRAVVRALGCRYLLVSFNDEGHLPREALLRVLRERGRVTVLARPHPRYVGARIGIHNPRGERVGRVGRLRNREFLFLVTPEDELWAPPPALAGTLEAA